MSKEYSKILVVEDEPDVCNSLQSYFGRRGFMVSTTPSGQEALSIIKTSKPDIVLLDLKLSEETDINGIEVLKRLRQYDKETKVIVITGQLLKDEEIENIRSFGISEYMHKPILLEKLQETMEIILGRKFLPQPSTEIIEPQETQDVSLSSISHDLSNLLTIIRSRCETFALNIEENIYKDKSDKELVKMAVQIMDIVIKTVDRATQVVEKIYDLDKKGKF